MPSGSGEGEVLVVGDLLVDVVVVPSGPIQHASDVPSRVRAGGGGSAANTACWLASTGRSTALVAMVGDDAVAPGALADLEASGVVFAGATAAGEATGTCVVLVDPDGERTMFPDRGANDRLEAALVVGALARRSPAWLHLSGYTLLDEGSRPAGLAALERARSIGLPASVDASSAGPLRHVGGAAFLDWVDGVGILFANDDELDALGGARAVVPRAGALVVKHGPAGVSWVTSEGATSAPAETTAVVDTIGAGDALDAGVIAAVLDGASPRDALAAGTHLAAQAVARTGARPPTHA